MKKLLMILLLIPFISFAQKKNVLSTNRIYAKAGKTAELEKAIADHAKKYHSGDWSWRVFEVQSGPDVGAYHITEGPNSWTRLDERGDISSEHMNHWNTTVAPLSDESRGSASYSVYRDDLSTVALTDWADKISISHIYVKPGCYGDLQSNLRKAKKAWESNGATVAVYESHFSGQQQFTLVYRHKTGWKEKEEGFRKPFFDAYETVYGRGEFDSYADVLKECVDKAWGEMLVFRKDLGTPQP
jgi:hypothetical protein